MTRWRGPLAIRSPCAPRRLGHPARPALLLAALLLARCSGCCPADEEYCDGQCKSLESDPSNCGQCDRVCPTGAGCTSGECVCPRGQEVCGSACVDPARYATDPANCGGCGVSCGAGTCSGGICDCGAFSYCPAHVPRCVDGLTDPRNCGLGDAACGHACPLENDVCEAGVCECPADAPDVCGSRCVNPLTDAQNCGSCARPCPTLAACVSGTCECPAEAPEVCGADCVDPLTNPQHCGSCGWACPSGGACTAGYCSCPWDMPSVCRGDGTSSCCAGPGCCPEPSLCPTAHSTIDVPELRQVFWDCLPLGTYDLTQALRAAQTWQAVGDFVSGPELHCESESCAGWRTAAACGVWCYGEVGDPLRGRVSLDTQTSACVCPTGASPSWN